MFVSAAMAYADTLRAEELVVGSKGFSKVKGDSYSFYDSTLAFYSLMEALWRYTTEDKRQVKIVPILAQGRRETLTKKKVYAELLENDIGYEDTWSCFKKGIKVEDEWKECGECHNCLMKKQIFSELKQ